jgi:hypothetical protein
LQPPLPLTRPAWSNDIVVCGLSSTPRRPMSSASQELPANACPLPTDCEDAPDDEQPDKTVIIITSAANAGPQG